MSLFGNNTSNSNSPNAFNGYQSQLSVFGQALPILLGTARIAGVVIWIGDWTSSAAGQSGKLGGKASGGGKGGGSYNYSASFIIALCQGPASKYGVVWQDRSNVSLNQTTTQSPYPSYFATGTIGQAVWPYLVSSQPASQQLPYSETVLACYEKQNLGSGGTISNYSYEISGQIPKVFGIVDVGTASGGISTVTWVSGSDFSIYSINQGIQIDGRNAVIINMAGSPFHSMTVQWNVTGGPFPNLTIGWPDALASEAIYFLLNNFNCANIPASLIGSMAGAGGLTNYCLANGIGISPIIDQQNTLSSYLQEWLLVCNAEAFSSEGLIKFATYGDKAITGNGATFTPDLTPIYNLGLDDFITGENSNTSPVVFSRVAAQDINNHMTVEWTNRGNQYNLETMNDEDAWSIQYQVGARNIASTITIHSVCQAPVAQQVLTVQLKRSVYITRKAAFTLGWAYSLLEPMDIVTIPEQYPSTGNVGVRILTIDEDDNGNLSMTGEILPFPILNPALNPKQSAGGFTAGFNALPGATNPPIFFEVTPDMANVNFAPVLSLVIGLSGGPNWGGCAVYLSKDGGASYEIEGTQNLPSNMGSTTGVYPFSADPDTTHTLSITLQESLGVIDSVAQSVADNFKSLILVDDELMSYAPVTLTGANTYDFNSGTPSFAPYMRRGVFGTFAVPHASGAPFLEIDGNQFEYQLQPNDIGLTLWFKFPAFNLSQQQQEDVSTVTAYPFTVRGSQTRAPLPLQPYVAFQLTQAGFYKGNAAGMRLQQASVTNADGSVSVGVQVTLVPPANTASTLCYNPGITVAAGTGGSIPAGTYLVAICGLDTNGIQTDFYLTTIVLASGSATIVASALYPTGTVGYQLWVGIDIDQLNLAAMDPASTPATITISTLTPIAPTFDVIDEIQYQASPLDTVYDHTLLTAYQISHGGVWGDVNLAYGASTIATTTATASSGASSIVVASATGIAIGQVVIGAGIPANTYVTMAYAGGTTVPISQNTTAPLSATAVGFNAYTITFGSSSFTLNQFAGYRLKLYVSEGAGIPFIPLLEVTITANAAGASAAVYIDTNLTVFVSPSAILSSSGGDVWVCRMKPQSITATGFSDPNFVNSYGPSGLVVNQDAGTFLFAIGGTGAGQIFNSIIANTTTGFTIQGEWAVTPDATTEFVIVYALPLEMLPTASGPTQGLAVATGTAPIHIGGHAISSYLNFATIGTVLIPNQNGLSVLIVAQAADANGNLADFGLSPKQECYIFGDVGNSSSGSAY